MRVIDRLAELAFRSRINSMIIPEDVKKSPKKEKKRNSIIQSFGRLAEPPGTNQ